MAVPFKERSKIGEVVSNLSSDMDEGRANALPPPLLKRPMGQAECSCGYLGADGGFDG